jgi:hypothetical protein
MKNIFNDIDISKFIKKDEEIDRKYFFGPGILCLDDGKFSINLNSGEEIDFNIYKKGFYYDISDYIYEIREIDFEKLFETKWKNYLDLECSIELYSKNEEYFIIYKEKGFYNILLNKKSKYNFLCEK